MWFKALLRLKINLDQSELMIPTSRVNHVEELVLELGCKEDKLPATYLGLPLVAPFRSVAAWDGVEERFRKRLSMWKRQYISKGGRLTLINSTLSSFSIYFMSLFNIPRKVKLRLEKVQRDFLRRRELEEKCILWCHRWDVFREEKRGGGELGIRHLSLLNKALLCKWNWQFTTEREAFWNQVISGKYGG